MIFAGPSKEAAIMAAKMSTLSEAKHDMRANLDTLALYRKMGAAGITVDPSWITKAEREVQTMAAMIDRHRMGIHE